MISFLKAINFPLIFFLLINLRLSLLFLLLYFFIRYRNITISSQRSFSNILLLLGMIIWDFFKLLLFLLIDLFYCLIVFSFESFDILEGVCFLIEFYFDLLLEIFLHFLDIFLVLKCIAFNFCVEVFGLHLLGTFEFIVFGAFLHDIFSLIRIVLLEAIFKLLFFSSDLLIEFFT